MTNVRLQRVQQFLQSASGLTERSHPLFVEAVQLLPSVTGLSRQNVEWALENALEVTPEAWDFDNLLQRVPECTRAHVLLSANVFVGALRAIALGLAASAEVYVRPSRREPQMVALLAKAAPHTFIVVPELAVLPGDHVWAYGSDETMTQLKAALPAGAVLHAHGHGFGIAVLTEREIARADECERIARVLAVDAAAFDQRGCLSPRVVIIEGGPNIIERFSRALAAALADRESSVPRGQFSRDELADIARYRDTLCMAGTVLDAGSGLVSFELESLPFILPPVGRVLHVKYCDNAASALQPMAGKITAVGVPSVESELAFRLRQALPHARIVELGMMQRPKLDGPVDLRVNAA